MGVFEVFFPGVSIGKAMDNQDLLKELRIDRSQREDHAGSSGRHVWLFVALALVLAAALAVGGWAVFGRHAMVVRVVVASAPS